uniref:IclR family transcriptional regulator n=1 Tax=Streptomyces sp. CA-141956 TaxID=3240051 RepID=UPI003F49A455
MTTDEKTPTDARTEGVRSVVRVAELLQLFDAHHPTRPLRDLVELTGLPKTTVVRLLATLTSLDLITPTGEMVYGLGAGFLRWVRLSQRLWEVNAETRAVMRDLVDECGETVNIYVRQDTDRICVAQEEGTATVRSIVEVGVPMPLTAGAAAKVLLCDTPAAVFDELAVKEEQVDMDALKRQVAAVNETGYAVTHGEREFGASAVAAPVRAQDGRVIAALSASGPTSRFTAERIVDYVPAVTRAAARITETGLGTMEAFL